MTTLLLFSLLWQFSFVSTFLTSLIKLLLWLKFITDKRQGEAVLRTARTMRSCFISIKVVVVMVMVLKTVEVGGRDHGGGVVWWWWRPEWSRLREKWKVKKWRHQRQPTSSLESRRLMCEWEKMKRGFLGWLEYGGISQLLGLTSLVAQIIKNLPAVQETWVQSLGQEDPLEKGRSTESSIHAWRIPWMEEPGWWQSLGDKESDTTEWQTLSVFHLGSTRPWILHGKTVGFLTSHWPSSHEVGLLVLFPYWPSGGGVRVGGESWSRRTDSAT